VRVRARARHYSRRTEDTYVAWIRRFILFHGRGVTENWKTRMNWGPWIVYNYPRTDFAEV